MTRFDLPSAFSTVADAIREHTFPVWRGRGYSYGEVNSRIDGVARYLTLRGPGCRVARDHLAEHQSGPDHLGSYLRNGKQYREAMLGGFRSRVIPVNVGHRYVEDEGATVTDGETFDACRRRTAGCKTPKATSRTPRIMRSPAGKADYRWASDLAATAGVDE